MPRFGYWMSSEEHRPNDLIQYAQKAEALGFPFAMISDHYHPWLDNEGQGEAPFVWSIIGGIAATTKKIELGTGVTCPTIRIHPAIIAQAAATAGAMMPGRFFLGVGTGENLNEHILGDGWPPYQLRSDMLEEAIQVIRQLWQGETVTFYGDYYVVEDARIFTLPDKMPPIYLAASGDSSGKLAGQISDGLISVGPNEEVVKAFHENGGQDKPTIAKLSVCYAESEEEALETVYQVWPNAGLPGVLMPNLRTVEHFEQAVKMVKKEDLRGTMPLGPAPQAHLDGIQELVDAGFEQICIHQIGQNQHGFFDFYEKEILPNFS